MFAHKEEVDMAQFELRLPSQKPSMERLARMDQPERDKLTQELLHAIWEADEAGELPERLSHLVRGWIAHARFGEDPVIAERRAAIQAKKAG